VFANIATIHISIYSQLLLSIFISLFFSFEPVFIYLCLAYRAVYILIQSESPSISHFIETAMIPRARTFSKSLRKWQKWPLIIFSEQTSLFRHDLTVGN
jgi:hypothetical protein